MRRKLEGHEEGAIQRRGRHGLQRKADEDGKYFHLSDKGFQASASKMVEKNKGFAAQEEGPLEGGKSLEVGFGVVSGSHFFNWIL